VRLCRVKLRKEVSKGTGDGSDASSSAILAEFKGSLLRIPGWAHGAAGGPRHALFPVVYIGVMEVVSSARPHVDSGHDHRVSTQAGGDMDRSQTAVSLEPVFRQAKIRVRMLADQRNSKRPQVIDHPYLEACVALVDMYDVVDGK